MGMLNQLFFFATEKMPTDNLMFLVFFSHFSVPEITCFFLINHPLKVCSAFRTVANQGLVEHPKKLYIIEQRPSILFGCENG